MLEKDFVFCVFEFNAVVGCFGIGVGDVFEVVFFGKIEVGHNIVEFGASHSRWESPDYEVL